MTIRCSILFSFARTGSSPEEKVNDQQLVEELLLQCRLFIEKLLGWWFLAIFIANYGGRAPSQYTASYLNTAQAAWPACINSRGMFSQQFNTGAAVLYTLPYISIQDDLALG